MKVSLSEILDILATRGHAQYGGEPISQLEHSLQCATLAQKHSANAELITACLLHDLGHLIHEFGEDPTEQAIDDRHEHEGAKLLQMLFSEAVTQPISLHVEAKQYLCVVDPAYYENLSANSKSSLLLQGGAYSKEDASIFIAKPYAKDAVKLRIWDDLAKVERLRTPDLNSFRTIVESCLLDIG
ncbi:HD phosphohydrolase-like protein [Pseudanabaena sp. lw0831]|uniref:phosphonate degradation HD-domain oxygenase n=1 Tax=Pseudanabaena sp. lw0831 TaxID=1357935 RepID=UPI001915FF9A|nr:phosphonate degradation HD-domain oxygenase [Pseudanabaena sp. lw0831]GBO54815.1 HD phosphohydrolase-like protein [Pseudanabaena sp. lw0831]